jgi:hypothetical protein
MAAGVALEHAGLPNSSALSILSVGLGAALFACIYLATGRLATAIGVHLALNFVEGPVLGFPVSGQLFGFGSLVSQFPIGPDVLTGGAYGPEAGLIGIGSRVLLLAATIAWLALNWQPECCPAADPRGSSRTARAR